MTYLRINSATRVTSANVTASGIRSSLVYYNEGTKRKGHPSGDRVSARTREMFYDTAYDNNNVLYLPPSTARLLMLKDERESRSVVAVATSSCALLTQSVCA